MFTMTMVADVDDEAPMRTALVRVKRVRQALKRKGIDPGEWTWTLEQNPKETGFHLHAVQHGPYLPQSSLQAACKKARAGMPYIEKIKGPPNKAARYGLKGYGAAGYGLKTFKEVKDAMRALALNHHRLEHHTRGFFRVNGTPSRIDKVETHAIDSLTSFRAGSTVVATREMALQLLGSRGAPLRAVAARYQDVHLSKLPVRAPRAC